MTQYCQLGDQTNYTLYFFLFSHYYVYMVSLGFIAPPKILGPP